MIRNALIALTILLGADHSNAATWQTNVYNIAGLIDKNDLILFYDGFTIGSSGLGSILSDDFYYNNNSEIIVRNDTINMQTLRLSEVFVGGDISKRADDLPGELSYGWLSGSFFLQINSHVLLSESVFSSAFDYNRGYSISFFQLFDFPVQINPGDTVRIFSSVRVLIDYNRDMTTVDTPSALSGMMMMLGLFVAVCRRTIFEKKCRQLRR